MEIVILFIAYKENASSPTRELCSDSHVVWVVILDVMQWEKTCWRVIAACKWSVLCEKFVGDVSRKYIGWQKWYEGVDKVFTVIDCKQILFAHQYWWGSRSYHGQDVQIHVMRTCGDEDLVVLGVYLAQVSTWGSLPHVNVKSPCSDLLVEFARNMGCDPRVVDNQVITFFIWLHWWDVTKILKVWLAINI